MRARLVSGLIIGLAILTPHAVADQVLYQYTSWFIKDGKSGPIATFQNAINAPLAACDLPQRVTADGVFGNGTKTAIKALTNCETISAELAEDSPAREGAITAQLWSIVLPETPVPSVGQRAASLKLTFEATDYDRMQWNFCQNRPFYDPDAETPVCVSNDRASFITWGPNGATAGHGREVQAILNIFLEQPDGETAFNAAFGSEADAARRMLTLKHEPNGALETYLCGVWLDKPRRAAWKSAFRTLGRNNDVKTAYRRVYDSRSFDGGKIARFYKVWTSEAFDLSVTEMDHAWFVDRATHMSISQSKLTAALRDLKESSGEAWPPTAGAIRQYVSLNVRPPNQREDRLGRDIAYYVDAVGTEGLNAEEASAWGARGRRNAIDIGMSDERMMPDFEPAASLPHPMPTGTLSEDEAGMCPDVVLNPTRP